MWTEGEKGEKVYIFKRKHGTVDRPKTAVLAAIMVSGGVVDSTQTCKLEMQVQG